MITNRQFSLVKLVLNMIHLIELNQALEVLGLTKKHLAMAPDPCDLYLLLLVVLGGSCTLMNRHRYYRDVSFGSLEDEDNVAITLLRSIQLLH